jgi:hypothetical protein
MRTATIATMLSLLLVSSAEASCAWVLWQHFFVPGGPVNSAITMVSAMRAHETRDACEADALRANAKVKQYVTYICFPDTIDPRDKTAAR